MAGAPTVLSMMRESPLAHPLRQALTVTTAGAPPSPSIIEAFAELNVQVVHVYGLTETYGPYTVCEPQDSWQDLPVAERSRLMSRQGVGMITADEARVVATYGHSDELVDVPADGVTMGEIVMRGNTVMKEYFRDPEATAEAFQRRLVPLRRPRCALPRRLHPADGPGQGHRDLRRREHLHRRGGARPRVPSRGRRRRGDRRPGRALGRATEGVRGAGRRHTAGQAELIGHVKEQIAKFKAPKSVDFVLELPRTSTGKIRKDHAAHGGMGRPRPAGSRDDRRRPPSRPTPDQRPFPMPFTTSTEHQA